MKNTILGVIDATGYYQSLEDLLLHRSLAALPIGGRYRLIDFVLSNMVNSDIGSVAIFPKFQYRSLMDHLGSGKNWDLNRKRDGLFFFPAPGLDATDEGVGSFNHFAHHLDYFYRSSQEYAIISNCYTVCNINYRPVLERHMMIGCDITEIRHNGKSLEMYLVKTSLLRDLIESRDETGYTCMKDVVEDMDSGYKVCGYEHIGFVETVDSINKYYNTSLKLLNVSSWKELFKKESPIYTKVKDEPPTRYTSYASVKNSIIANGCYIEGNVRNSTMFRAVKVGKNTTISGSIIMQKSQIGDNCVLENVILDKDVRIEDGVRLIGDPDNPIVIRKGMIQGALMNS
ncbi:glucose-1-phosphate adenylyltransferase [Rossellomorea aquimaris]|uniref:sugar phosphate nucleotidyltransferase n=1 Tax=Rossellomorea aquimaris TaxID=189382 RepID=UPI001CD26240|nr:sugar phosphate nucleotidyltransferase [Rossellomorea aquimaris]MCA1056784.1 glucose-1-phosphate adenylyltransferase [Rossellomorea aquimaris]